MAGAGETTPPYTPPVDSKEEQQEDPPIHE